MKQNRRKCLLIFAIVWSISMTTIALAENHQIDLIKEKINYYIHREEALAKLAELEKYEIAATEYSVICEENPVWDLSDYNKWYIASLVAGEARGETEEGMKWVATCIANTMEANNWSPEEVRYGMHYDGFLDVDTLDAETHDKVMSAVESVFTYGEIVTNEYIMYFHNPTTSRGTFHKTQKFVASIGNHDFYAPISMSYEGE